MASCRQQEIAFLNQAYAKVEAVNFELEQYKQENKELQNALAQATEEQEAIASQLYETGHLLDEAHTEVRNLNSYSVLVFILSSNQGQVYRKCSADKHLPSFLQIEMKEKEVEEARAIISSKEQEIEQFLTQRKQINANKWYDILLLSPPTPPPPHSPPPTTPTPPTPHPPPPHTPNHPHTTPPPTTHHNRAAKPTESTKERRNNRKKN